MSKYIVIGVGDTAWGEESYLLGVSDDLEEAKKLGNNGPSYVKVDGEKLYYTHVRIFEVGKFEAVWPKYLRK